MGGPGVDRHHGDPFDERLERNARRAGRGVTVGQHKGPGTLSEEHEIDGGPRRLKLHITYLPCGLSLTGEPVPVSVGRNANRRIVVIGGTGAYTIKLPAGNRAP